MLREGIDRFRNDEVIEYPHVDQRERFLSRRVMISSAALGSESPEGWL